MAGMFFIPKTIFKNIILLAAACIIPVCVPGTAPGYQSNEMGIVKAAKLNVRMGPEHTNLILMVLEKGNRVEILEHDDGWLKISYKGQTGYIRNRKKYIQIIRDKKKDTLIKQEAHEKQESIDREKKTAAAIKRKKEIDLKIRERKLEVQEYTEKEAQLISGLDKIEQTLNKTRIDVLSLKQELSVVEKKLNKTTRKTENLIKEVEKTEKYSSKRLVALYKLNTLGRTDILASAESIYEVLSRKKAMELILEYDENVLEEHTANKARLLKLISSLKSQKKIRLALEKDLQDKIRIMDREKTQRTTLLADIRDKKSLGMAAIDFLKQSANALDQTIVTLHADDDKPQETIKNEFVVYKGLLKMPVKGRVTLLFGPYKNPKFSVVNFRSGIEIEAKRGDPIRTVFAGQVLYASWFKGYGNMIIVDHGNSYYTVYAHADGLLKSKGDSVGMDEIIGTVGDSASMTGPGLYFEVRHHGKPMDPLEWLSKG
jgi:septal ring factor EnvC (AmiA/AmiB activator)